MKTLTLIALLITPIMASNTPVLVKPNRAVLVKPNSAVLVPNITKAWYDMLKGVKHFEGFRSNAYTCCGGKRTIGYGHTGIAVSKGIISEREASDLLEKELHEYKEIVLKLVKVPLTDYQLASLTSFTYNCGRGALYQLISQEGRLNDGNYQSVSEVMPMYRMAGGKVRKGLEKRRKFEVSLWNNAVEQL